MRMREECSTEAKPRSADRLRSFASRMTTKRVTKYCPYKHSGLVRGNFLLRAFAEQFARDDHALHLAGPFVNSDDARIAVHALDFRLSRIPDAAVHLHRLVDDTFHHFAGVELRLRRSRAHFRGMRVLQPRRVMSK